METFIHDVRHGFRSLIKSPGLTGAAIVSLALGIGANTTLFTWVKAVLLRPVPGASDPASLHVAVVTSRDGIRHFWSYPNYRDVRARARTFDIIVHVVVGIARDIKYGTLDEPSRLHVYFNLAQRLQQRCPVAGTNRWRSALARRTGSRVCSDAIDPNLPLWDTRPVSEHMEQAVFPQRIGASLLGVMSALALLLRRSDFTA